MFLHGFLTALIASLVLAIVANAEQPKKLLLIYQGPDGHPATTHEYLAGVTLLEKLLKKTPGLEMKLVKVDEPWRDGPELLKDADGVLFFLAEGAKWTQADAQRAAALTKLAARGGSFVALHWAIGTRDAKPIDGFLSLLGGCHGGPDRKFKIVEVEAQPADVKHPIATGIGKFKVKDEFYYQLKFTKAEGVKPVLRVPIEEKDETVAWSWERADGGRSFGFSGLHFHDNWKIEEYRRLVAQGVLWTLKLPIPKEGLKVDVKEEDLKLK